VPHLLCRGVVSAASTDGIQVVERLRGMRIAAGGAPEQALCLAVVAGKQSFLPEAQQIYRDRVALRPGLLGDLVCTELDVAPLIWTILRPCRP
jgi:hypothetical protein